MKTIKIKFVDFDKSFDEKNNDFVDILKKHYTVEFSDDPEYLFYSCFGYEHTKYSCIKIFYTGECVTPDFNSCDYAIGFDNIQFGDRYIRVPLYELFQYKSDFALAKKKHLSADEILRQNRKFCSFVVSNDAGQKSRKEVFDLLSQYKQVDSGGRYLNNIGYCVPNKHEFQSQYKFSMAFENCVHPGYTTEKLLQAFAAGTIPIYYGNPDIALELNEDAFVNCHRYSSFTEVLEQVKQIDADRQLYEKMLRTPILLQETEENRLESFLTAIFDQDAATARRRPLNTRIRDLDSWGRYICMSRKIFKPFKRMGNLIRRIKSGSAKS